jgi:hypothetical protein
MRIDWQQVGVFVVGVIVVWLLYWMWPLEWLFQRRIRQIDKKLREKANG